ncbi:MAG: hypothetical protein GY765_40790, partial [bacterium]|nr:hypothetical protein [bacterium]
MEKIKELLKDMLQGISGFEPTLLDGDADLVSLGLDSLMLVELRRKINGKYGVDIQLNDFFTELSNLDRISEYIDSQSPVEPPPEAPASFPGPAPGSYVTTGSGEAANPGAETQFHVSRHMEREPNQPIIGEPQDTSSVERIMVRQLDTMMQLAEMQLETLGNIVKAEESTAAAFDGTDTTHSSPQPGVSEEEHIQRVCPMSSLQERLVTLSRTSDGERAYHIPMRLEIEGPLDINQLEATVKTLIRRHEILRTGLEVNGNDFVQRIYPGEETDFSCTHKKGGPEILDAELIDILRPFDLSRPPLLRVSVLETGDRHFILLFNTHHALLDGNSLINLVHNLLELYQGLELPPVKRQYKDFALWERQYRNSAHFDEQEQYWMRHLG